MTGPIIQSLDAIRAALEEAERKKHPPDKNMKACPRCDNRNLDYKTHKPDDQPLIKWNECKCSWFTGEPLP